MRACIANTEALNEHSNVNLQASPLALICTRITHPIDTQKSIYVTLDKRQ